MFKPMQSRPFHHRRYSEQGYILITLTLIVALLAVAALAIAPTLTFQIRRDREEEMIHRGVQYSRAIQKYFKKFGRYPVSLDNLVNTNNQRFLRKRYKDPITGKDFKLLHYGEVQMMNMGGGIAGATPASAMPGTGMQGMSSSGQQGFSLSSGPSQSQPQSSSDENAPADATSGPKTSSDQNASSSSSASPQIVGGPIVGVTSFSKETSIREFGGKNHYNQWQFTYDPTMQRLNGLINTPAQPLQQGMAANVNGQPGAQGTGLPASGFGSNQPGSSTNSFGSQTQPAQTPAQNPAPQPQPQPPDQ